MSKTNSFLTNIAAVGAIAVVTGYTAHAVLGSPPNVHVQAPATAMASNTTSPIPSQPTPFAFSRAFGPNVTIAGPYTTKNLQVYLLRDKDATAKWPYIALHDAIAKKTAVVKETGNVNNLSITNKGDVAVFIHSGDIVKGGNQDRMSQFDVIIGPKQTMALAAFCVEHDRWTQRGREDSAQFAVPKPSALPASTPAFIKASPALQGATNGSLAGMMYSARHKGDQSEVWSKVAEAQSGLELSTGKRVKAAQSESSLELTLESETMQTARLPYIEGLRNVPNNREDSVGYIAFVDGKYVAGDKYATHQLFQNMWSKMLPVRATDAVMAEKHPLDYITTQPTDLSKGSAQSTNVNARTIQVTHQQGQLAKFDTLDKGANNICVHAQIARKS